ncbi:poly(3-hydroxybutyrate) depolymerase [Nonomuraea turkmeniaca]|uniref:Poly(3-hydroxybutyrate) depolymerase n=1 Tax=Nonomuraea turkmeniaca TaxID=103838 RepID=A0A5S4FDM0_9ACTN|nr:PHB depolymerase family esterase [Nonomuraea turkmeniaca]TMR16605.1 poly(3-hydroxybutyrate) depolymerase [Nonomuraea turkmeniaca]
MRLKQALLAMTAAAGLVMAIATVAHADVPPPTEGSLRKYDITATYVSGVSAGGYMANQLHVAHSSVFQGVGIMSAGPYGCADGDDSAATIAQNACMKTNMRRRTPAELEQMTRDRAAAGTVDPVANLSGDPVWLLHGSNDQTVLRAVNDDLATYYRDFGANVVYNTSTGAGHGWVSPFGTVSCASTASPYVNDCGTDPQREMLGHLFGSVNAPATTLTGKLIQFGQNGHAPGGSADGISMGNVGFAYVPQSCESGPCKLMVALHGCYQYHGLIGDTFMDQANLNEYADTNNMIVLYPQAKESYFPILNPRGCWNWWAYGSDTQYAQKNGKQITAIMNMVTALGGGPGGPGPTPTPTPTPECVTAHNVAHTMAMRAYAVWGQTYAMGSGQHLGPWSSLTTSSIKQTSPGNWVKC